MCFSLSTNSQCRAYFLIFILPSISQWIVFIKKNSIQPHKLSTQSQPIMYISIRDNMKEEKKRVRHVDTILQIQNELPLLTYYLTH
jgi:hypothetical protein